MKGILKQPWFLLLAGGLIMGASLGTRHVQGLFLEPVTFDRGWSREAFAFAVALQNLLWGLAQPFTGMIADKLGSVRVIVIGTVVYALGLFVMAHSTTTGMFTLGDGLIVGVGLSGTAFGTVYGAISRLFPVERRSWALGVAGAIGGLGQFCMVPFVQGIISSSGWVSAAIALAILMIVLSPLAVVLRDNHVMHESGGGGGATVSMSAAIREAISHKGFWLLNFGFLACGFQLAFIAGHLPAYLLDKGMGYKTASAALALIALANVVGTYMCGYLGGFLRRKYVLSVIYLLRAGSMALFITLPLTHVTIYTFSFIMGLIWLGTLPLTIGIVSQVFGVRYIATLFGFVFFGHQLGAFFGVWLGGYVFDVTKSYDLVWYGAIGLGLLSALLHWPINDKEVVRSGSVVAAAGPAA